MKKKAILVNYSTEEKSWPKSLQAHTPCTLLPCQNESVFGAVLKEVLDSLMLPPQTGPKFVHTEQNQIQKRPKKLFLFKIDKGQWHLLNAE